MTTVPTPSDSQDGARRRDDAAERPRRIRSDGQTTPAVDGPTMYADRLDELKRERDEARAETQRIWEEMTVIQLRLEAERDAMKADLASLGYWYCANCERRIPDADVQRDEDRDAFCPYSTDQLEWSEPETLTSVKAHAEKLREGKNRAFAERDEARATVRRMLHAATELLRREMQHSGRGRDGHLNVDDIAIVLNAIEPPAVDQTAPSSPQETSHTADDGEAGVVEGAGGSEAAEACPHRNRRCPRCRCVLDAGHDGDHDVHCGNGGGNG